MSLTGSANAHTADPPSAFVRARVMRRMASRLTAPRTTPSTADCAMYTPPSSAPPRATTASTSARCRLARRTDSTLSVEPVLGVILALVRGSGLLGSVLLGRVSGRVIVVSLPLGAFLGFFLFCVAVGSLG